MSQKQDQSALNKMNLNLSDAKNAVSAEARVHVETEQYLTFFMGREEFGVNILSVQEIRGWEAVTPIPNSPAHVQGVMNLRGTVVPIVDLRMCFGIEKLTYTDQTVVIILVVPAESGKKVIGVVADAVSDVYNFETELIQPSPELSQSKQAQYVRGLASTVDKLVILLDLSGNLLSDSVVKPLRRAS